MNEFGNNDMSTFKVKNNLAESLRALGRYFEAEELQREVGVLRFVSSTMSTPYSSVIDSICFVAFVGARFLDEGFREGEPAYIDGHGQPCGDSVGDGTVSGGRGLAKGGILDVG